MTATLKNYQGALLGLAVGDALGATTENMWVDQIKEQHGELRDIIGGGWLRLKAGEITDDTGMTLATCRGILRAGDKYPIPFIGNEFLKWQDSKPKDIGTITANALYYYTFCSDWRHAAFKAHKELNGKSAGNGSLMRILPLALAYQSDLRRMQMLTVSASEMTHFDVKATEACLIYNCIAKRVIDGEELKTAIREEVKDTRYKTVLEHDPRGVRPSGYVVDTFLWVLRVLLTSDSYEEVVIRLANMGSDSDTTAAIAGGLAGLYYDVEAIPERLASKILLKDEILQTAEKLYYLTHDEYDRRVGR